jgi:truncated hemoglobin YjbI
LTLYEQIGEGFIEQAITEFYQRAFSDPLIGHFFFNKDINDITNKQIIFASRLLGATHISYKGKTLKEAHQGADFRTPHFDRRQILMKEVLADLGLDSQLSVKWLYLENQLRPLVLHSIS